MSIPIPSSPKPKTTTSTSNSNRPPTPASSRPNQSASPRVEKGGVVHSRLKPLDDSDLLEFLQEDPVFTTAAAAVILGLSPHRLEKWRQRGQGPAYLRYSGREVRYEFSALLSFKAAHCVRPARQAKVRRRSH